ncbi:hypothetical protein, partial [uncultured Dietzia sp.]|uniref:hypothetical protein n=1 Tax=uncultured Dietzia sp. TaxID=395519 RepID=UPI0025D85C60
PGPGQPALTPAPPDLVDMSAKLVGITANPARKNSRDATKVRATPTPDDRPSAIPVSAAANLRQSGLTIQSEVDLASRAT